MMKFGLAIVRPVSTNIWYNDKIYPKELLESNDIPWVPVIEEVRPGVNFHIHELAGTKYAVPVVMLVRDPIEKLLSALNFAYRGYSASLFGIDMYDGFCNLRISLGRLLKNRNNYSYNVYFKYSSAYKQIEHIASPEIIFCETDDITYPHTIDTMKALQRRFSFNEPDDYSCFNQKAYSIFSHVIGTGGAFSFYPDERGIKIEEPVLLRFFLEKVPLFGVFSAPNWRFWGEIGQDVLPNAGKVQFYYVSGSNEDFDRTKNDDNFHVALRTRTVYFLEKLARYNAWAESNYHRWSMDDVFNYFKENKRDKERFICLNENELNLIYKHAPNMIKNWAYYNELLKMK